MEVLVGTGKPSLDVQATHEASIKYMRVLERV